MTSVPSMLKGTVSLFSMVVSCVVGTLTLKLVTPAGTVMVPSVLSTTPLLNTGWPMSSAAALPPPRLNG